jgi:hypothetical protein
MNCGLLPLRRVNEVLADQADQAFVGLLLSNRTTIRTSNLKRRLSNSPETFGIDGGFTDIESL